MLVPQLCIWVIYTLLFALHQSSGGVVNADNVDLPPGTDYFWVPQGSKTCHWREGGNGQVTRCMKNEVIIGSCGSDDVADCYNLENPGKEEFDRIWCCEMEGFEQYNCEDKYGGYGEDLTCVDENKFVGAVCGSGEKGKCNGYYHMISCCDGKFVSGPNAAKRLVSMTGDCKWYYDHSGIKRFCPADNEVVVGRCGSGRDKDCNGYEDHHGIHCCKVFAIDSSYLSFLLPNASNSKVNSG